MPKRVKKSSKTTARSSQKAIKRNLVSAKTVGLLFIFVSLIVLFTPTEFLIEKPIANKNPIVISSELLKSEKSENTPVRILIPSVDIDLPVVEARIVDGYWELSETTASYGLGSGYPGTNGNTVIFAHARKGLFYELKDVKEGDAIYVFSKDKWFRYKVNKITQVFPHQIETVQPTKNETLTLYTCSGFNDEKRLIISATPQK